MINNIEELKNFIITNLEDKKASDILVIDLKDKTSLARYMIFANGTSIKNIGAIADHVSLQLKYQTNYQIVIEGLGKSDWVVVDAGEIMVHLFHPEIRELLQLDKMWS